MIFVTLGSQKFQFNRLLKEIDILIEENIITEEVFAQIGYSDYKPQNYRYKEFLDRDEFSAIIKYSDKVITHGGTGAIVGAIKKDKKVIAVPRLSKFGEHVDDHQIQLVDEFKELNFIESVYDISQLKTAILEVNKKKYNKYKSNTVAILDDISNFIE